MNFLGLIKFWREISLIIAIAFCVFLVAMLKSQNNEIREYQISNAQKEAELNQNQAKLAVLKQDEDKLAKLRKEADLAANEWHSKFMMLNNDLLTTEPGKECEGVRLYLIDAGKKLKGR